MREKIHNPSGLPVIAVPVLVLFLLLNPVCITSAAGAEDDPGRIAALERTSENLIPDSCTFDHLARNGGVELFFNESCYFETHSPMDFLRDLENRPDRLVMVLTVPEGWITMTDAAGLMQKIDSDEPAAPVVSPLSSYWPVNQSSTAGNEAAFLLEGYRTGRYPPGLCSLHYFRPDTTALRDWWNRYGQYGLPDERDAIRLVRSQYSDMSSYPSDQFPRKIIKSEKKPDGWYLAFIEEGSGVPILSARCFFVDNDRKIRETGAVNHSIFVQTDDFSPEMCGCRS